MIFKTLLPAVFFLAFPLTLLGDSESLSDFLSDVYKSFSFILPESYLLGPINVLDLDQFSDYREQTGSTTAEDTLSVGRYLQNRQIYQFRQYMQDDEPRSVHLGIDLGVAPGTPVFAPMDSMVHSFQDNAEQGDYGPTVILEHNIEGRHFFTLYGHLNRECLQELAVGQFLKPGEPFAKVGQIYENGGWPPHVHFQIIESLGGATGQFIGVAKPSEIEKYSTLCPDPNLILQLPVNLDSSAFLFQ